MIARGAPVGAVCLRCQLRLLRRLPPVRHIVGDASNGPRPDDDPSTPGDRPGGGHISPDGNQDRGSRSTAKPRPGTRRPSHSKRYVSRNRLLKEAAESLGSDMLGKPAYAIVMRDGGNLQRRELPRAPEAGEPELEPEHEPAASIEATLDSQREPPTLNEVRSNIDSLQPKTEKALSEKDFRKLQRLLTGGFLSSQLYDYVRWRKSDARREPHATATATAPSPAPGPEFPWIEEKTAWMPLQTQAGAVDGINAAPPSYVSSTTPTKERLAVRLMRECWGLSIAELQTQLGEVRVKLRRHEFALLLRGTQRFINTLGKIWLEPGEKIEAFRDEEVLRLVTTEAKADSLLRDLDETLRSVTTKTFPVLLIGSEAPDDDVLEDLGRITNSHVRKSHTLRRLHVTWIEVKSRAERGLVALEDTAHIVFRLLLTASGVLKATSTLHSPVVSRGHSGRLIVDDISRDKLAWKDRLSQWARFVFPVTPTGEGDTLDPTLKIGRLELPFEPTEPAEDLKETLEVHPTTKFPFHPVKWSNVRRTSTVANFGHVLHPYTPANPTPHLSDLLRATAETSRHIFVPTPPHPIQLSRLETTDRKKDGTPPLVTTKSTLVLRFWPSPSSNPTNKPRLKPTGDAGDTPKAPILELRLATSENEVRGVESLRAVTSTLHTDVLLPSSPVDVRLTQTQYETVQARDRDALAQWQPIADFLRYARLDLDKGKLEMPPRQRFPIPWRLFAAEPEFIPAPGTTKFEEHTEFDEDAVPSTQGQDQELFQALLQAQTELEPKFKEKKKKKTVMKKRMKPDDLVSVSYEFVGLEFHCSATLPYEGHQLIYTSIEAGQGGGRRAEVTLEPLAPRPSSSVSTTSTPTTSTSSTDTTTTTGTEPTTEEEAEAETEAEVGGKAVDINNERALLRDFLQSCSRFVGNRAMWTGVNRHTKSKS